MLNDSHDKQEQLLFYAASDLAERVRYGKRFRNSCSGGMALEAIWKLARFLSAPKQNTAVEYAE
jgi:hypothetical protein